jgi:hypothetical protein
VTVPVAVTVFGGTSLLPLKVALKFIIAAMDGVAMARAPATAIAVARRLVGVIMSLLLGSGWVSLLLKTPQPITYSDSPPINGL